MDAPGLLVSILGLVSMAGLVLGVLGWQRAALAAARVGELEREDRRHRATRAALGALVGGDGWEGDSFTVRGTVRVRR